MFTLKALAHTHFTMSAFVNKPPGGWIHSDALISKEGATYAVRVSEKLFYKSKKFHTSKLQYVGCLEVKVSMKKLDFKTRTAVAK